MGGSGRILSIWKAGEKERDDRLDSKIGCGVTQSLAIQIAIVQEEILFGHSNTPVPSINLLICSFTIFR